MSVHAECPECAKLRRELAIVQQMFRDSNDREIASANEVDAQRIRLSDLRRELAEARAETAYLRRDWRCRYCETVAPEHHKPGLPAGQE